MAAQVRGHSSGLGSLGQRRFLHLPAGGFRQSSHFLSTAFSLVKMRIKQAVARIKGVNTSKCSSSRSFPKCLLGRRDNGLSVRDLGLNGSLTLLQYPPRVWVVQSSQGWGPGKDHGLGWGVRGMDCTFPQGATQKPVGATRSYPLLEDSATMATPALSHFFF